LKRSTKGQQIAADRTNDLPRLMQPC